MKSLKSRNRQNKKKNSNTLHYQIFKDKKYNENQSIILTIIFKFSISSY